MEKTYIFVLYLFLSVPSAYAAEMSNPDLGVEEKMPEPENLKIEFSLGAKGSTLYVEPTKFIEEKKKLGEWKIKLCDRLFLGKPRKPEELGLNKKSILLERQYKIKNSDYPFEAKANPFIALKGYSDVKEQMIWVSPAPIMGRHVKEVIELIKSNCPDQSIHLNTGGHGEINGETVFDNPDLAEIKFLEKDLETIWDTKNVSFHLMSSHSGPIYPTKANHVINSWCYSKITVLKPLLGVEVQNGKYSRFIDDECKIAYVGMQFYVMTYLALVANKYLPGQFEFLSDINFVHRLWALACIHNELKSAKPLKKKFSPVFGCDLSRFDDSYIGISFILSCVAGNGYLEILRYLVEECNIDADKVYEETGVTPLMNAAMDGQVKIVEYLVEHAGANVNQVHKKSGMTLLHIATRKYNIELIKYLIKKKVDIDAKDFEGRTALNYAETFLKQVEELKHFPSVILFKSIIALLNNK